LRGERSLPATIELVKIRTRQFAKRQMTWFRRQMAMKWIEVAPTSRRVYGKQDGGEGVSAVAGSRIMRSQNALRNPARSLIDPLVLGVDGCNDRAKVSGVNRAVINPLYPSGFHETTISPIDHRLMVFALPFHRAPSSCRDGETLGNGIEAAHRQARGEPTVAGGWVAHGGSSNERPGHHRHGPSVEH